ncbi:diadenosine hexaphosphate hydrolase [Candidatus Phycosocius bacilliformis]|uniref:Diadenosine hexaphosphate hydrolase n=1 Tax=Candidatus Phycosocius bacilliformis TaxID=1445552 RepID=A0A2P2EC78_9PROT|nr:NUDIX domain-containing protein [Candidatus Phycosocius bacilliformis]GBF58665.1 diadenosine hexaphosphate hydrolase [Candidatus Phycosocius bacilliformis]
MTAANSPIRQVGRVLILNHAGEVFLLRGRDPAEADRPAFWFTPGGKIDPGETAQEAAARELWEEVGLKVSPADLGEVVGHEDVSYHFNGIAYRQQGVFFALWRSDVALNPAGLNEMEADTIDIARWWSLHDVRTTQETIYPVHLADMLVALTEPKAD